MGIRSGLMSAALVAAGLIFAGVAEARPGDVEACADACVQRSGCVGRDGACGARCFSDCSAGKGSRSSGIDPFSSCMGACAGRCGGVGACEARCSSSCNGKRAGAAAKGGRASKPGSAAKAPAQTAGRRTDAAATKPAPAQRKPAPKAVARPQRAPSWRADP